PRGDPRSIVSSGRAAESIRSALVKRFALLVCACLLGTISLAQQPSPSPSPNSQPAPPAATGRGRGFQPRQFSLQAISSGFWKRIDKKAKLTTVATGFGFTEGPVWDSREGGFLYVSDEEQNHIYRVNSDGSKTIVASMGDPDGSLTTLTDHYEGQRYNSPNDIVMGPDGAYYFTDPTLDLPKGQQQETPFQGVYRLARDGKVTLLTKELDEPNGLAFSPDGKRLYMDDS